MVDRHLTIENENAMAGWGQRDPVAVVEALSGRVAHYECLLRIIGSRGEAMPSSRYEQARFTR